MNGPKQITANFDTYVKTILLSPNGHEAIPSGADFTIRWGAPPKASKLKLFYSVDNGTTWTPVKQGYVTGSSYEWTVPVVNGNRTKCFLKVVSYNNSGVKIGADKSDLPFTIEVVRLTLPNGGEPLTAGVETSITWTMNETMKPITKIQLFYTKNGGTTWKLIEALPGTFSPGPYTRPWIVPGVGTDPKTKCKVKVVLKDSNGLTLGSDTSDAYFAVSPPP
jgi:hypothetical protein